MKRMKWIEDLYVRGVRTQGIVLDGCITRIYTVWSPAAASRPTVPDGFPAGPDFSCLFGSSPVCSGACFWNM